MASEFAFIVKPKRGLLTATPDDLLQTHTSLHRLVEKCHRNPPTAGQKVAYDLSDAADIDPGAVLLLMYAAHVLINKGWPLVVYGTGRAYQKLASNVTHLRLSSENRQLFPRDPGEYPLRAVESKENMVEELEDWAVTVKRDTHAKDEDVAVWQMQIGEVVTNSFQHGAIPTGNQSIPRVMLCGGFKDGNVHLAALDTGCGIPSTIERVADEKLRQKGHVALIKKACQMGITSKSTPQNQGYGLPHLINSVKSNHGRLQIFSQRGLVHLVDKSLYGRKLIKSDRGLNGTLTVVSLRV